MLSASFFEAFFGESATAGAPGSYALFSSGGNAGGGIPGGGNNSAPAPASAAQPVPTVQPLPAWGDPNQPRGCKAYPMSFNDPNHQLVNYQSGAQPVTGHIGSALYVQSLLDPTFNEDTFDEPSKVAIIEHLRVTNPAQYDRLTKTNPSKITWWAVTNTRNFRSTF